MAAEIMDGKLFAQEMKVDLKSQLVNADFDSLTDMVRKITPMPGGVSPMTITVLLYNRVKSAWSTIK